MAAVRLTAVAAKALTVGFVRSTVAVWPALSATGPVRAEASVAWLARSVGMTVPSGAGEAALASVRT